MENLVRRLASRIALSLGYDAEKEAVVAYGLLAIVQVAITVILALLFGFLVGAPVEAMIVCFSVSILR
ncbi:MAG: accessory gene regulator B family protein, partial [Eubacteriales bacterium]|nr:accessory gene regulator B family protein [Eubacteriales bacterium]